MEASALELAATALGIMLDPSRLMVLAAGVMVGLTIGVIPGLGGIVGIALLIPFTFEMDAYSAFAFLIGMGSVTTTSDTVPAVLFGIPGTTGSAATILDGHPLAKQDQAGRAFGAASAAMPASIRGRANSRVYATRCTIGGWCCAAVGSAPPWARFRALAPR